MKEFLIKYKENKKYNPDIERSRIVLVSKTVGDNSIDAKNALGVFIATTGTLKRNEIISIQELDENRQPVGEPITPMEGSSIVPEIIA